MLEPQYSLELQEYPFNHPYSGDSLAVVAQSYLVAFSFAWSSSSGVDDCAAYLL